MVDTSVIYDLYAHGELNHLRVSSASLSKLDRHSKKVSLRVMGLGATAIVFIKSLYVNPVVILKTPG